MLRTCSYTLYRDGTIGNVSDTHHIAFRNAVGRNLWDEYPGLAETGLADMIDRAWQEDVAGCWIFYGGTLAHVWASRVEDGNPDTLTVSSQELPLEGLTEALAAAEAWLVDHPVAA